MAIFNVADGYSGLSMTVNRPDGTEDVINRSYKTGSKYVPECSLGVGVAFYPFKSVGVFAECAFGKFHFDNNYYKDNTMLRYGVSFKF